MSSIDRWAPLRAHAGDLHLRGRSGRALRMAARYENAQIFLGLRIDGTRRSLAVPCPADLAATDLPACLGFNCHIVEHPLPDPPVPELLLVEEEGQEELGHLFDALCTDLLELLPTAEDMGKAMLRRVESWVTFFETTSGGGLSRSARRGLYGELVVLEQVLAGQIGLRGAAEAWTAARRTDQDFQWEGRAVEVKTTVSSGAGKVRIASLRQLDGRGLNHLLLSVVRINERDHAGELLAERVARIKEALAQESPAACMRFMDRLIMAGFIESIERRVDVGFAMRCIEHYNVVAGFPRLLPETLPNGIGKVRYELELTACQPWSVTFSDWFRSDVEETDGR